MPSIDLACVVVTNQSNAAELAYSVFDEVMANHLPDWRRPEEYCGFPSMPFLRISDFYGRWQGVLQNGGAKMRVQLDIESAQAATLGIGTNRAQAMTRIRAEGEAFTGMSTGAIKSPDAIRTSAKTLQIKLVPRDNQLVGRVFAIAGDPNFKNVRLPYVLTLRRGVFR